MAFDTLHAPLRDSLNRASTYFFCFNAANFDKAPVLGIEYLHLRARLERVSDAAKGYSNASLDKIEDVGMLSLASDLISFINKIKRLEFADVIPTSLNSDIQGNLLRQDSLDEWDEDVEGD